MKTKFCKCCNKNLQISAFYKTGNTASTYRPKCKNCTILISVKYRKNSDDKRKAYSKQYYASHRKGVARYNQSQKLIISESIILKACSGCRQVFPITEFWKSSTTSGYASHCKTCVRKARHTRKSNRNAKDRAKRAINPKCHKFNPDSGIKWCHECKKMKHILQFGSNIATKNKMHSVCKSCAVKRSRDYRLKHPEKQYESYKIWANKNQDKVKAYRTAYQQRKRKWAGKINSATIYELISTNVNICVWCNKKVKDKDLSVEHLTPLSRGGTHDIENLAIACRSCNAKKGTSNIIRFLAREMKKVQE